MCSVTVDPKFVVELLRKHGIADPHPGLLNAVKSEFVNALEADLRAGCTTSVGRCVSVALDTVNSFPPMELDYCERTELRPGCVQNRLASAPPVNSDWMT